MVYGVKKFTNFYLDNNKADDYLDGKTQPTPLDNNDDNSGMLSVSRYIEILQATLPSKLNTTTTSTDSISKGGTKSGRELYQIVIAIFVISKSFPSHYTKCLIIKLLS